MVLNQTAAVEKKNLCLSCYVSDPSGQRSIWIGSRGVPVQPVEKE